MTVLEIVFVFDGRAEHPDPCSDLMPELIFQAELANLVQRIFVFVQRRFIAAVIFIAQPFAV